MRGSVTDRILFHIACTWLITYRIFFSTHSVTGRVASRMSQSNPIVTSYPSTQISYPTPPHLYSIPICAGVIADREVESAASETCDACLVVHHLDKPAGLLRGDPCGVGGVGGRRLSYRR